MTNILRDKLEVTGRELYSRLLVIEQKARDLLEYSQGGSHLTYTPHGLSHISKVEENLTWLIEVSDLIGFNKTEIFCLLVAVQFHDAFMIPKKPGDEARSRAQHASHAAEFLVKTSGNVGLSIHEAHCIGEVIKGHGVKTLTEIEPETVIGSDLVDQRKLAACLSLADICHADASRAPRIVSEYLDLDPESLLHWRRHLQIGGITRKNDRLLISGTVFSDEGEKAVRAYCDDIRHQLQSVKPYFHSILTPITDVDLIISQASSPVERRLSFRADMSKLLDVLIRSVYSDRNVFLRELVQNSLDACRIREASLSDFHPYRPQIVCTALFREGDELPWGVRVDDNGIGMSINDFEDTVLWLGRSISSSEDVKAILAARNAGNLIGVFGIGMMSCFGVAEEIIIRSAKENSQAFEVHIRTIFDNLTPHPSMDVQVGTSVIVSLKPDVRVSVFAILDKYFQNVTTAVIKYGEDVCQPSSLINREQVFVQYEHFESLKKNIALVPSKATEFFFESGASFGGLYLWYDSDEPVGSEYIGDITVLCGGIFVCETKADKFLPKGWTMLSGAADISIGGVDLAASRENFVRNDKLEAVKEEIRSKFTDVIRTLVKAAEGSRSDLYRYLLCLIFSQLEFAEKAEFYQAVGSYQVRRFGAKVASLAECANEHVIYMYEPRGQFVESVCSFNDDNFYKERSDLKEFRRYSLERKGYTVLASRVLREDPEFRDTTMMTGFLEHHGVEVISVLAGELDEAEVRSRPVSAAARRVLGQDVKFVDFGDAMDESSLFVGRNLYLNLRAPEVQDVLSFLENGRGEEAEWIAQAFIKLHKYDLEGLERLLGRLMRSASLRRG